VRLDLMVEPKVILDLKAKAEVTGLDQAKLRPGLIMNFHSVMLKDGISRMMNGLPPLPEKGSFRL